MSEKPKIEKSPASPETPTKEILPGNIPSPQPSVAELMEARRQRLERAITPRGSGRAWNEPHMVWATHKIPDWKFWPDMPKVQLWQACALSLNLDPDSLTFSNDGMGGASYIKMQSFPNEEAWEKFNKRLRLLEAKMRESRVVPLADFVKWASSLSTPWDMPPELVALAQKPDLHAGAPAPAPTPAADLADEEAPDGDESITTEAPQDADMRLAKLFDAVGTSSLEKMFPAAGNWSKWTDKAKEKGLAHAREDRGKYNPYLAALWWLDRQNPDGWDRARCCRVLANNLPTRSKDSRQLLMGELE